VLLSVKNLVTTFTIEKRIVVAVNNVSFDVKKGRTLSIVGESGCGKSVTALSIMRLIQTPPGNIKGDIIFNGQNLLQFSDSKMQKIRGNKISMIFQEPMTSLNPVFTVGNQLNEVFMLHQNMNRREATEKSIEMLKKVGISSEKRMSHYPHQLSGGMRQRIMIAMALACRPELLIADEPSTALDVTIQAQILALMSDLQKELGMSLILITHDLGVVAENSDDVIVMYAGKIVEQASVMDLFKQPSHPYTMALLKSIPQLNADQKRLYTIKGMVPSLDSLPVGCSFQDRCQYVTEICRQKTPELETVPATNDHRSACFNYKEILANGKSTT